MISTSDLRQKEIINIVDGRRLGFVSDIEVNLEKGRIDALIVPGPGKFLSFFGKENDFIITWHEIRKIGMDVILVELKDVILPEELEEKE
ncbi:sporulation protein, YlmC/YmxH family [Geosporobacter subterraneus DSM 17957]|uniref:Sporulation protein, YlmC/YmxH family n=1 Tax=Geosporobacter subterraneus DSM 17957 TaxID=1121919 RepID=A0A1M6GV38_9FIRM|nr:YlmC/YmxH family sporulation protein [Geosporobacter subterraneus]SHJ13765.1 sporulation protein, YlmC/YmxH family [Geosporobacter subterraneus DSM 17957]